MGLLFIVTHLVKEIFIFQIVNSGFYSNVYYDSIASQLFFNFVCIAADVNTGPPVGTAVSGVDNVEHFA